MSEANDEKRKSLTNFKEDIKEARVVANYGDPGLDEDYHFDILSRYVVVQLESCKRVPTVNKWSNLFAIVARPEHLWIDAPEGKASSPSSQRRSDRLGNVNIGTAASPSVNGIARINAPYELGEIIKIKKIPLPVNTDTSSFFLSSFPDVGDTLVYNSWHSEGSTLSYFAGQQNRIDALRYKTIYQIDSTLPLKFGMRLYKYQYEAFMLNYIATNASMSTYLSAVFANTIPNSDAIYKGHGGYVFNSYSYVNLLAAEFEDINVGNKQRVATNECMPLIVATPNTFPTPRTRAVGNIQYNPTYATIIRQ